MAQPIEVAGRGRRQGALHEVDLGQRRQLHADRKLRRRHRSRTSTPSTSRTGSRWRLPQLPEEVSRQGVTVKKKSSAILQVLAVYSPDSRYDTLFLSNYATINILDNIKRVPGVGDAYLFGALDYSMRVWLNTDRLTALGLTPTDVANALQGQNIQAAVGPDRRAADRRRPVPAQHPDQGPADRARGVRERRRPRQPGRLLRPRARRRPGRAGRADQRTRSAASTAARVR